MVIVDIEVAAAKSELRHHLESHFLRRPPRQLDRVLEGVHIIDKAEEGRAVGDVD